MRLCKEGIKRETGNLVNFHSRFTKETSHGHYGDVIWEHFREANGGEGKPQATCTHCSQTVPPIGRDSKHRSVQYLLVGAHVALCNAVQPTPSEDFTALERRYGNPQGSYSRLADDHKRLQPLHAACQ